MTRYIAFLRGINVGGHKIVKMEHLRQILLNSGLHNVQSYIQSGNVSFDSDQGDAAELASELEALLVASLGFEVKILLRTAAELRAVVAQNPLHDRQIDKDHKLYVTFLPSLPSIDLQPILMAAQVGVEACEVRAREIYIYWLRQPGKSLESHSLIEKRLRVSATTRDWTVVSALVTRYCSDE